MSGSLSNHTLPTKKNLTRSFVAALVLIPVALLAQSLAPTPHADQAELSKVKDWVLSQGTEESIAPEMAAILGIGSDRLPVKVKSFRTSKGIDDAFAASTNPKQEGIVLSALKTMTNSRQIYSVGNAWLTDRSGNLRSTIYIRRQCLAHGQIGKPSQHNLHRCFWGQDCFKQLARSRIQRHKRFLS